MSIICLWSPVWRTRLSTPEKPGVPPEVAATLLARAPRVATGRMRDQEVIWADARGFSTPGKVELAQELITLLAQRGVTAVRAGIADTPIAAALAANHKPQTTDHRAQTTEHRPQSTDHRAQTTDHRPQSTAITIVPPGTDRSYVGLFPIGVLDADPRLAPLLFGIGVSTCGELAALSRESVEVRLGPTAIPLWKLARADDPRLLFAPAPPDAPHASLDWVEYALRDPMRLLFVLNNLIEKVCTTLAATGEGARELTIEFALTNKSVHVEMIRAARATASRRTWSRLTRARVECITLTTAVTGIAVHASKVAAREAPQGDLFDKGLASSEATEDAVARLIEDQGAVVVAPDNSAHPLLDERTTWTARKPQEAVTSVYAAELTESRQSVRITPVAGIRLVRETPAPSSQLPAISSPKLMLQLAPSPLSITVETSPRRDHLVPVRFRDTDGWHELVNVAGPERISGRTWDADRAYAREYFRCVTKEGVLVWLYCDARERVRGRTQNPRMVARQWYLHGWWD